MECVICKQCHTEPSTTTVTMQQGELVLVVRGVPASVCANCGEAYTDEEVTARLLAIAEEVAREGAQVDIRQCVAA